MSRVFDWAAARCQRQLWPVAEQCSQYLRPGNETVVFVRASTLSERSNQNGPDAKIKKRMSAGPISQFIRHHFRHFNAATLVDAAEAYKKHLEDGGKMFLTLAGAMSTAELGVSLAEMIRRDKVHAICCTGANLEEDVFNLVAHDFYERVPNWRDLKPEDEQALLPSHESRYGHVHPGRG